MKVNNVTDDELSDRNGNACSVSSPVNGHFLAVYLILKLQELLLLLPVTARGNEGCEENTTEDCEGLNILLGRFLREHGKQEVDEGSPDQENNTRIFKLPAEQIMESLDLGWRNEVLSVDFPPSVEIGLVSNNARFGVSI